MTFINERVSNRATATTWLDNLITSINGLMVKEYGNDTDGIQYILDNRYTVNSMIIPFLINYDGIMTLFGLKCSAFKKIWPDQLEDHGTSSCRYDSYYDDCTGVCSCSTIDKYRNVQVKKLSRKSVIHGQKRVKNFNFRKKLLP